MVAPTIKKPDNNSLIVNVLNKLLWSAAPYLAVFLVLFLLLNFTVTAAAVAIVLPWYVRTPV